MTSNSSRLRPEPTATHVRGELGRGLVERRLDRIGDLADRIVERVADLLRGQDHRLRQTGHQVAPADLGLHLVLEPVRGPDLELDLLRGLLADQKLVLLLDVVDDRLVHLVTADAEVRKSTRLNSRHGKRSYAAFS